MGSFGNLKKKNEMRKIFRPDTEEVFSIAKVSIGKCQSGSVTRERDLPQKRHQNVAF